MVSNLQTQRAAIAAHLSKEISRVIRGIQPGIRLPDTQWQELISLVTEYSRASAAIGVLGYRTLRRAHVRTGARRFAPRPAAVPTLDQITASLDWALYAPGPSGQLADAQTLETRVHGTSLRLVRQPDRETTLTNVEADPEATRWAREPEGPYTCAFCALLCTRGAVYLSDSTGAFKAHDHCDCVAVPVFEGQDYRSPAHVESWDKLYIKATKNTSGQASIAAFRTAYESRFTAAAKAA